MAPRSSARVCMIKNRWKMAQSTRTGRDSGYHIQKRAPKHHRPGRGIVRTILFDHLATSDLYVDAVYQGGRRGNAGDEPLPRLMRVDSHGGFRKRGEVAGRLHLLVLTSSLADPDWPDSLDRETGVFTYYGDNKLVSLGMGRESRQTWPFSVR